MTTTYSVDESGNVITEGNEEIILGNMPLAKKIGASVSSGTIFGLPAGAADFFGAP